MKSSQILLLLALFYTFALSCREIHPKEENVPKPENTIPSTEHHHKDKSTPQKAYPVPHEKSRDSTLKKRTKSKDLDTLMPRVALLG